MLKGVPVGTKISLLTRGGVRYEGVLYELNRIKETMSVKSVRSFGTEGRGVCRPRRDGNPEVSASNEIFDCMTFRGADLIDVKLLNAPKVSTEEILRPPKAPPPKPPRPMEIPAAPSSPPRMSHRAPGIRIGSANMTGSAPGQADGWRPSHGQSEQSMGDSFGHYPLWPQISRLNSNVPNDGGWQGQANENFFSGPIETNCLKGHHGLNSHPSTSSTSGTNTPNFAPMYVNLGHSANSAANGNGSMPGADLWPGARLESGTPSSKFEANTPIAQIEKIWAEFVVGDDEAKVFFSQVP
eukprot:GEMP01057997.1.p1 GENE.GEMP01057997.1~~GEMP01057997.1.p1  ORF type:complete len:297 (+),score=67.03 GEMP01057997.1:184-1074(+)